MSVSSTSHYVLIYNCQYYADKYLHKNNLTLSDSIHYNARLEIDYFPQFEPGAEIEWNEGNCKVQ